MFTGIVEAIGEVMQLEINGTNRSFRVKSPLSSSLKIDQSLSHDGVCLTVEAVDGDEHRVTAIAETLEKSNLGNWKAGTAVNLERCMQMNGRLDGHIVQGHVDTVATCTAITDKDGSTECSFKLPLQFASLVIEKGSISINGISLTLFNVGTDSFSVALIPYTFSNTNIRFLQPGQQVNVEFDMIGKYVNRIAELQRLPQANTVS